MVRIWRTPNTSLTVDTDAMSAGDALGVKTSFSVPEEGIIRSMSLSDVDDEASVTVNVWVFESEPTGIATNAAFALADSDAELVTAVYLLNTEFNGINNRVKYKEMSMPYRANGGKLWIQCELQAATPTFAAATDVKLRLTIEY